MVRADERASLVAHPMPAEVLVAHHGVERPAAPHGQPLAHLLHERLDVVRRARAMDVVHVELEEEPVGTLVQ
eukprot:626525-Lingulodinium_polyedra.AAC.1